MVPKCTFTLAEGKTEGLEKTTQQCNTNQTWHVLHNIYSLHTPQPSNYVLNETHCKFFYVENIFKMKGD